MKTTTGIIVLFFMIFSFKTNGQNLQSLPIKKTEWLIADFLKNKSSEIEILGNPKIVTSPYGDAVVFNGIDDAFFLKQTPLKGLESFTVEMIFKPEVNAPFEQRVLHIGEITGDRMLLEIRAVEDNWYFDGFAASKGVKLALAKEDLLHPLEKWYHVTFVVTPTSLTTFVNGKQELHEMYTFKPIELGQTSIGMRMNKVTWFKGAIYKIKISPTALKPNQFLAF